jgi:hypothetical protein
LFTSSLLGPMRIKYHYQNLPRVSVSFVLHVQWRYKRTHTGKVIYFRCSMPVTAIQ